jgi:hypothetical protein
MADLTTPDLSILNPNSSAVNPSLAPAINSSLTPGVAPTAAPEPTAIRQLDPIVGKAAPALYAAGSTTPLTVTEQNFLENWSKVKLLHEKLMAMPNDRAMAEYAKLQPAYQQVLYNYYGVDYGNKPSNSQLVDSPEWRQSQQTNTQTDSVWSSIKQGLMSPFRAIGHAADFYSHILTTPIHMLENSIINHESFWSKKNLEASFDGKMLYDNGELNKLMSRYGQETSYVATHLLAGETPGQIIQQYGTRDRAVLESIQALFQDPVKLQQIIGEYDQARLSPGRDAARWLDNTLGINRNQESGLFKFGSGLIDASVSILADPLTYLTMGGSAVMKGMGESAKLGDALLNTRDVAAHFANPRVANFWGQYGKAIDELKAAKIAGDKVGMAKVENKILNTFPEHGSLDEQQLYLSHAMGLNTPMDFEHYWKNVETNISPLIRGAQAGAMWQREGAAIARKNRGITQGLKQKSIEFFTGKLDYDALDKVTANSLLNEVDKIGAAEIGSAKFETFDKLIEENRMKGWRAVIRRQTSYAPGSGSVNVTNNGVAKTAETFRRQAFVALNDRVIADVLTQHFLDSSVAGRINLKRAIDEATLRRFGVHNMGTEGERFMNETLNAHYGEGAFSTVKNQVMPSASGSSRAGDIIEYKGPANAFGIQDSIAPLNMRNIKEFTAGKYRGSNVADEGNMSKASRIIGGAFNSKTANNLSDIWGMLTLIPQLGIRTAIDEGYQFAMYMNLPAFKEIPNTFRTMRVLKAYNPEEYVTGPAKQLLYNILGKVVQRPLGPGKFISNEARVALKESLTQANLKTGKTSKEVEDLYHEELMKQALAKYGKGLPEYHVESLKDLGKLNPSAFVDSSSARSITASLSGKDISPDKSLLNHDQLNASQEAMGYSVVKDWKIKDASRVADADLNLYMFRNFVRHFNSNAFKIGGKESKQLDAAALFLKHNGLKDSADWQRATNDFLKGLGFEDTGLTKVLPNDAAKARFQEFVDSTRQFEQYAKHSDLDKATLFAQDMFANIYHTFHGGAEQFNKELLNYFKPASKPGSKIPDHRLLLSQMDLEKYSDLVKNHKMTGEFYTQLDQLSPTFAENLRKNGTNNAYDVMGRQTDAIYRQPVVHLHYLQYRQQYAKIEKHMKDTLIQDMTSKFPRMSPAEIDKRAQEQASRYFTEHSMNDAVRHVMKFSDNPEMHTIFADNVRAVGRFYRAVEDFHRRTYRLLRDNGVGALYKMRLQNQGFGALGTVHTDQNGDQYVVMPFDNIIYGAVNKTLNMFGGGLNQPTFDNITFKLTAGNPSFQNDAGMPYLSGPLAGVSVVMAKALLGIPDTAITNKLSNNVDNFALGSYGDNVNIQKAIMPRIVQNLWNDLSPDEQSQQEVSALTQAICYSTAHGLVPDVSQYQNPDGSTNVDAYTKAKADYLNNLRISAHNLVVTRGLLGMIMPSTVQLSDNKDLPDILKDNGLPSMQSSFYDILDGIGKKYPEIQDKYEMALATWMGKHPGQVAYTLSKKNKEIVPIMKYSKDMESWVVENKNLINQYGSAATLFAPNTGKFNPGTFNYMTAAGLAGNVDVQAFYDKALLQQSVNKYYDINNQEANQLMNIGFNDLQVRQQIVNAAAKERLKLEIAVPGLKEALSPTVSTKDAVDFVNNAHTFANAYPNKVDANVLTALNTMYGIYTQFIDQVDNVNSYNYSNANDIKMNMKNQAVQQIEQIIASDPTKVLQQYYDYGIKRIMNEHVRDARVGVNRNG